MKRGRIFFYTAPCRRGCGTMLATASRSILGADALKRKYELICDKCLTPEEHDEILRGQAGAILGRTV